MDDRLSSGRGTEQLDSFEVFLGLQKLPRHEDEGARSVPTTKTSMCVFEWVHVERNVVVRPRVALVVPGHVGE